MLPSRCYLCLYLDGRCHPPTRPVSKRDSTRMNNYAPLVQAERHPQRGPCLWHVRLDISGDNLCLETAILPHSPDFFMTVRQGEIYGEFVFFVWPLGLGVIRCGIFLHSCPDTWVRQTYISMTFQDLPLFSWQPHRHYR